MNKALIFFLFCNLGFATLDAQEVQHMKVEYLVKPLGIDNPAPRFVWKMKDDRKGAGQSAYRVILDIDSSLVASGKASIWNSGWINSDAQLITYGGKKLQPFTRYYWRVELKDHNSKPLKAGSIEFFETGMMEMKNWMGAWITDVDNVDLKPAPYFRKQFKTSRKIRSARAYIAAAGLYELSINGQKIGNHRLDPTYSRFDRRNLYVTYDVTREIVQGDNAIGVLLGNGWYNHQSIAVWDFHKAVWRGRPAFCLDLRITYTDGSVDIVTTDKSWKTSLSPVVFNSIYTSEHWDFRLNQPGWNTINFDDSKWKGVYNRAAPSQNIVSQALHPIRNVETVRATALNKIDDTTYVFDFGRNISGVVQIMIEGEAGTVVRLKHSERLYPNGRADQSNIDVHYRPRDNKDPFQTDILVLSGNGRDTFMPKFNYKGFQYVELTSGKSLNIQQADMQAYFMHSDVPPIGKISSSSDLINKMWWATNNSYLSNLFGYPTDCPQREKNGWTGDAHIASETGLYNFDAITVYEKWMADHRDEQQPNGVFPSIIPTSGWGYEWGNGPDWTSTISIIPWNIYLFYGDKKLLADCYENIRRYVDYITTKYPTGLTDWGLGDWVPVKSKAPVELTSSTYYYVNANILAKAAHVLGKKDDHVKYSRLAERIRSAINAKYLNKHSGIYGSGLQTELSVPLMWGIVPDSLKRKVASNLAVRVQKDSLHLDVGLLGTKAILNALSENGYPDIAYAVASQETFPSWGWWIVNGATTLFENWPIDAKSDISMNHIMFGEIGAWMYKALAGIKPDEKQPGFKNVIVEPHFVNDLESFEALYDSPYGQIKSSWKRTGSSIEYKLVIPANSTASLILPSNRSVYIDGKLHKAANGKSRFDLKSGAYSIQLKTLN